MADTDPGESSVYRKPTALTWKKLRPELPAIAGLYSQPLSKPVEKAEFLGVCLERQFAPNTPNDWDLKEVVSDETEDFLSLPPTAHPELTSMEEVTERISALRSRKPLDRMALLPPPYRGSRKEEFFS